MFWDIRSNYIFDVVEVYDFYVYGISLFGFNFMFMFEEIYVSFFVVVIQVFFDEYFKY